MAAASDRAEVDTARPFRSVKEAVAVFGERILVRESPSKPSANAIAIATRNAKLEASTTTSATTPSPNAMPASATVPVYSAPSSPPSIVSSPSPNKDDEERYRAGEVELMIVTSVKKLEAEMAETRQEVVQLRKRESDMELAVATLNAQLHRGLSKLAQLEAEKAAAERASVGGDTDMAVAFRSERWGEKPRGSSEYAPSLGHALSLGEIDEEFIGKRRRVQKKKPIVPLIGDLLFPRKKSTDDMAASFYSEELYSILN